MTDRTYGGREVIKAGLMLAGLEGVVGVLNREEDGLTASLLTRLASISTRLETGDTAALLLLLFLLMNNRVFPGRVVTGLFYLQVDHPE